MAASATFALKAGVCFRRGRLIMVSPDSQATACPPSGRNSTYRPVQISGASSWIFFKPFVPGENYKSKEAIVFPTLDSIRAEFASFYELASKEGNQNALYKHIFDKIHDRRL